MTAPRPEAWLRGPLPGVHAVLMPAAHALVQSGEELERAAAGLTAEQLWARPGGAASVGFHLRHVAGSIDRLLTYARGEGLTAEQLRVVAAESTPGDPPPDGDTLVRGARDAIERAIDVMRGTPAESLTEPRAVGRARLPTTVHGLLFHIAEHTARHTGQAIVTAKVVRAEPARAS